MCFYMTIFGVIFVLPHASVAKLHGHSTSDENLSVCQASHTLFFYYYCCSFLLKVFNWGNYSLFTCDLPENTLLTYLLKIGIYSLEIISICLPLSTFVKNKGKFVFLLPFYLSLRDGNEAGWGRRMGSSSPPHMVLSFPISTPPRPA